MANAATITFILLQWIAIWGELSQRLSSLRSIVFLQESARSTKTEPQFSKLSAPTARLYKLMQTILDDDRVKSNESSFNNNNRCDERTFFGNCSRMDLKLPIPCIDNRRSHSLFGDWKLQREDRIFGGDKKGEWKTNFTHRSLSMTRPRTNLGKLIYSPRLLHPARSGDLEMISSIKHYRRKRLQVGKQSNAPPTDRPPRPFQVTAVAEADSQ